MSSRPPHSTRFNRNNNNNNNNLNPTASTSSSTLVNELQDEKEKQQRLEYQATAGIHIFEAEGALPTQPQQLLTHLHHPPRKPFQPDRDQKLFKTLINSPSKLSRTTALINKRRSLGSLNQTTNNHQNHSETGPVMASLNQNQISLSSDEVNKPEDREDQDPDATFNVDLNDGTKRMHALFDSVAHSDLPAPNANQNTKNNPTPHLENSIPVQTEPKPKPRPPFEHLRGRLDKQNQETRRNPSDPPIDTVNRTNGLSTHVTSRSHASSKALSTQRVQAHNQLGHNPTKTSSSQNIAKSTQESLFSHNTITKDGWRSGPLMTTRESTSDTDDSPEDTFKPPLPSDLTNNPPRHSIVHNDLLAQKSIIRGPSDPQKKVTFSRRLNDSHDLLTSGSSLDPGDLGPLRSDSTDPEDARLQTEPKSSYNNPEEEEGDEEGPPEQTLHSSRFPDAAAQTTLDNTPRIAGFYPSTPATITRPPSVASRFLANEEASRRLEKLKNQTPRARPKRLPSALQDQPVPDALNQNDHSAMTANHLQPSNSQASKPNLQAPVNRNGKGKEKQVEDSPFPSAEPPQTHPTGPVNRIVQESYDQTIITGEQTRASCFPTPHPPGWLVPSSPGEPSSSTGPANRPILHPTSAMKHARQKGSSRYGSAQDRVIYASNHAVDEPADEVTPRPSKRPAHRTLVAQKSSLNKDAQQVSTSSGPSNPNFTLPSFDGFDHPRQAHLTSTPVAPLPPHHSKNSKHILPPSTTTTMTTTDAGGSGPGKTLKDLAAAVIEFIVDKKPIEVLADTFSMNTTNRNNLNKQEKRKTIQAKKADVLTQEKSAKELEELLRCSERVEEERRRIQAKLDDLCPSHSLHSRPSRLLSLLKTFFFSFFLNSGQAPQRSTMVNKGERHVTDHHGPWIRRHWKASLVVLLFQAACFWMVLHLSTIRSYNLLLQSTLASSTTSTNPSTTTSTSMMVSGSLGYMSRDRLASIISRHPPPLHLAHLDHVGVREGVVELARFLCDWAAGFPTFLHPFHPPQHHHWTSFLLPSCLHPLFSSSSSLFRFFFPSSSSSSSTTTTTSTMPMSSHLDSRPRPSLNLSSPNLGLLYGDPDQQLRVADLAASLGLDLDHHQLLLNHQFVPFVVPT